MKKVLLAISLLLSLNAFAKPAQQEAPVCPSLDQVKTVTFDSLYPTSSKSYAFYGDLVSLGTTNYWYEAEISSTKLDLPKAQKNLDTIDTQVNAVAAQDRFWGYDLWVCRYKSSQNSIEVVAATPIDRGGIFSSVNHPSALNVLPIH